MNDRNGSPWNWLLRNFLLPTGDKLFGSQMIQRLRFLEAAQWWDRERLITYRDQLLARVINISYREVPFYREQMDKAAIRPEQVRSEKDLLRLPISTKDLLRSHHPDGTTRPTGQRTFENRTSGSTGKNFSVTADIQTVGTYRASFLLALDWAGWQIGEPHMQTGITPKRNLERRLKDILLRCHYVSAFQLDDKHLDQALNVLEKYRIQHLWGYPGGIYLLARRALAQGWNQKLSSVVTWGDNLYSHYRKTIEHAFGGRIFDHYGCSEGIQISAQCGQEDTYHVHTLDVIVEYLDEEGVPVPEGETGNLILTRLFAGPMPLIRYRVGDVGVSGKSRVCSCGRGYEIMESIQGRDTDFILTPSGNRLIVHFFTGVIEHFPEVDAFQVIQDRPGSALLQIVPAEGFSQNKVEEIISTLKQRGAEDLDFAVEIVQMIPLTSGGKRRFVTSRLSQPSVLNEESLHP